jgi:hypothetical protein
MAMIAAPEALDELLGALCDYNLRILDVVCKYPIDGIRFGDDWGQQRGLIMGPAHWRRFIKPQIAKMFQRAHEAGKFVLHHSCGNIREIYDDVIEIGMDCHETFQPEIYDMEDFKRRYGDRLRPGDLAMIFIIWYSTVRFGLEYLRAGYNWTFFGVPTAQVVAGAFMQAAVAVLVWRHRPGAAAAERAKAEARAQAVAEARAAEARAEETAEESAEGAAGAREAAVADPGARDDVDLLAAGGELSREGERLRLDPPHRGREQARQDRHAPHRPRTMRRRSSTSYETRSSFGVNSSVITFPGSAKLSASFFRNASHVGLSK